MQKTIHKTRSYKFLNKTLIKNKVLYLGSTSTYLNCSNNIFDLIYFCLVILGGEDKKFKLNIPSDLQTVALQGQNNGKHRPIHFHSILLRELWLLLKRHRP
jgi:hypothetical protein